MSNKLPCEELQARARLPGTSFAEQGKTVSVAPRSGESVAFFRADTEEARDFFGATGKFPDLLVLRTAPEPAKAMLIELKGSDWRRALEQLRDGLSRMKGCVGATFGVKKWSALVVLGGGAAPSKRDRARLRFEQEVGIDLDLCSSKRCDLRRYLP